MRYLIAFLFLFVAAFGFSQEFPRANTPFQVPVNRLRPYSPDSLHMIVPIYQVADHWVWGIMHRDSFMQGMDLDSLYLQGDVLIVSPDSGQCLIYNGTVWINADCPGASFGDSGGRMAVIEVKKSVTPQATGTSYANIVTYETPDTIPPYWSFDETTGYLTIDSAGRYMIQVNANYYNPNDRDNCFIQAQYNTGAGWTDYEDEWISYQRGAASPDNLYFGQLHGSFWWEASAGDTLRLQQKHEGGTGQLRFLRWTTWRMHLGGGAVGPPGEPGADEQCLTISETDSTYSIGIENCPDSVTFNKGNSGIGLVPRVAYWNSTSTLSYGYWYLDPYSFGLRNILSEWPYLKSGLFTFTQDTTTGMRRWGANGDLALTKQNLNYGIIQMDGAGYLGINPANSSYTNPEEMSWVFTDTRLYSREIANGHLLHQNGSFGWYSWVGDENTGIRRFGADGFGAYAGNSTNAFMGWNGAAGLLTIDPNSDGTPDITADATYMAVEQLLIGDRLNGATRFAGINGSEFVTDIVPGPGFSILPGGGSDPDTASVSVTLSDFVVDDLCPPDYLAGITESGDTISKVTVPDIEDDESYVMKDVRFICDTLVNLRGSFFDAYEYQKWNKTLGFGASDTIRINGTVSFGVLDFDVATNGRITLENSPQEKGDEITLAGDPYYFTNYVKRFGINAVVTMNTASAFAGTLSLLINGTQQLNCVVEFNLGPRNTTVPITCQVNLADGDYVQLGITSDETSGSDVIVFERANINGHHIKTLAFPNF